MKILKQNKLIIVISLMNILMLVFVFYAGETALKNAQLERAKLERALSIEEQRSQKLDLQLRKEIMKERARAIKFDSVLLKKHRKLKNRYEN